MYNYYKELHKLNMYLQNNKYKEVVFFCAGNYKIWFDSFAPIFAQQLRNNKIKCFVYGGTKYAITADNIQEYMTFIENKHPSAYIVLVDNLVTTKSTEAGELIVKQNSTIPAGLINTKSFGNLSILFKVCHNYYLPEIKVYQDFVIKCLIKYIKMHFNCIK